MTIKTIEKTLGIKIDYYIVFNYDSVKKLVTALGGVPVYVEKDMHYTDRSGGLYVNPPKGEKILDDTNYGRVNTFAMFCFIII